MRRRQYLSQPWQPRRRNRSLAVQPARGRTAVLTLALLIVIPAAFSTPDALARPNIVVIMADDLDQRSLNTMVQNRLMPNLKRHLIDRGTRFTSAFVTTSLCCPSRATFLTGQYAHNHGVLFNSPPTGGVTALNNSSTLATWLHNAGYRTGLVGKYLNFYGFNRDTTTPVDDPTYIPPGWDDWQALVEPASRLFNYKINDNGMLIKYGANVADYQTDVLAQRAKQFINESEALSDTQPFFLTVTPSAPHVESEGPRIPNCTKEKWNSTLRPAPRHQGTLPASITLPKPPNFNEADMQDKPPRYQTLPPLTSEDIRCVGQQYRDRLESLRAVDDLIGGIVYTLGRNGEIGNTVLIFTSDNGWFYGEHRLPGKNRAYEESIRVPLFIRAPGFSGPQTTSRFALNTDLAPTLAAFADVSPELPVDGRLLIPLLANPNLIPWRKRFLVEHRITAEPSSEVILGIRTTDLDAQTPNRLYTEWYRNSSLVAKEIYLLDTDPYELDSQHRAPARAGEQARLSGLISQLKTCGNGTCQALED